MFLFCLLCLKPEHSSLPHVTLFTRMDRELKHEFLESFTLELCLNLISQVLSHVEKKFAEGKCFWYQFFKNSMILWKSHSFHSRVPYKIPRVGSHHCVQVFSNKDTRFECFRHSFFNTFSLAFQLECHFESNQEPVDNILKEFYYRLSSRGLLDVEEGQKANQFLASLTTNRFLR